MRKENFIIKNKTGLHARPASLFVRTAGKFKCDVHIKKGNNEIDAKSILSLLTLGAGPGLSVQIITDGPDENEAMQELLKLMESLDD